MKNNKYDFILTFFTDPDNDLRPVFRIPFKNENMVYATDAHSIIRMNEQLPLNNYYIDEKISDFKIPNAKKIYDDFPVYEFKTINTQEFLESFYDSKLLLDALTKECDKCQGIGEIECQCCGNDAECKECNGTGTESTMPISKVTLSGKDIVFMGKSFAPHLLYRVVHVALLLNVPTFEYSGSEDKASTLFKIDNVEIIIMAKVK